jgi:hypothetical protein
MVVEKATVGRGRRREKEGEGGEKKRRESRHC